MGTLIKLWLLTIAVGLTSSTFALLVSAETDEDTNVCSSVCSEGIANGDVKFAENIKHGYDFNSKTTIIAPTDSEDGMSEISIRGSVNVIGVQNCGAILYLKNIEIIQGTKIYGNTKLEGYPIIFSYNKGKVNPSICSLEKDSVASMNLKRAIVSAFQVSSTKEEKNEFFETDILGTCNTSYSSSLSNNHRNVIKNKDITKCTDHEKMNLFELSTTQSNPTFQDSPFSTAIQDSEIKIIDSTIKSVSSQETYFYQPFGAVDAVTKIVVSMSLDLKKRSMVHPPTMNLNKGRSIVFEKPHSVVGSVNADTLVEATQSAINNVEPVVEMDGAQSFANLISLLKVATKDDILVAFSQIKSGSGIDNVDIAKTVFINALIDANSGESIEAVVALISDDELSDALAISWFINLAKAKNPTKEAVYSASSLLQRKVLKEGYMGVGSLLRQYLKDNQDFNSPEVSETLRNLGAPLLQNVNERLSSDDEDLVIASLKGIGNVQYIDSNLEEVIAQIIMNKTVKLRIRAAALDMVKVYAKISKIEKACESVFTDDLDDSEIRIRAFKSFALNPSNYKATVIKNVLDNKRSPLQIRAYLVSYLNNLQTTPEENRFDQKTFYEGIKTMSQKKMLSDILRYSQNLQYSHQCPLLHSGLLIDGDVIYSQKSFLARSSSLSLKTAIFGRKYNIFDFDVRVENIESMLEKFFGPQGYFSKMDGNTLENVKNYVKQAVQYAKTRNIEDSPDSEIISAKDSATDDLKTIYIDLAIKVFGNDFGWYAVRGLESQITLKHIMDAIVKHFDDSMPDTKNLELNFRKQIPIFDYEKTYATISGLPITLKIQATSAIKLTMGTKFDLENYVSHPENSEFALKFIPSGSVTLNTLLKIDGYTVDVGYKVSSSVHTSTGSDFSFRTVHGRGFEVIYELPLKTMDVLSLKSGAFAIVQEKDGPLNEIPFTTNVERQTYSKSLEDFGDSLGLSISVNVDFPWNGELKSLLPFSGPSSLSVNILKVDENLSKYVMRGSYDLKSPQTKYVKLIFGTPEADINRNVQLLVGYDTHTNSKIIAQFVTPSNKVNFQGVLVNSNEQKIVEVKFSAGSEHIFVVGVKCKEENANTMRYSPVFKAEYSEEEHSEKSQHPLIPAFDLKGHVLVQRNLDSQGSSKYSLRDIAVVTPKSTKSVNGMLTVEDKEIVGNFNMSTGAVTIETNGFIKVNNPIYKMGGDLVFIRSEEIEDVSSTDDNDEFEPNSDFVTLLYKVKSFKVFVSNELHIGSPYVFISNNRALWDDDHAEINCDLQIGKDTFQMIGNVSTTNLLDLALNGKINVQPSTENRGLLIEGLLQHHFISDPSNTGYGNLKYTESKDRSEGCFEFNSACPLTLGVFHFVTRHHVTDELFKYALNFDSNSDVNVKADVKIEPKDLAFNINYETPDSKSYVDIHGWSKKENTYSFSTKLLWPGSENSNYLNTNGNLFLNGRNIDASGFLDFPLGNLKEIHVTVKNEPSASTDGENIALVHCVSNAKVLLSEKLKYTLQYDDDQLYLSGESIAEHSKDSPLINFIVELKEFIDADQNTGQELSYTVTVGNNEHKRSYQRSIQVTEHAVIYRQSYKIDDDVQTITMDLDYDFQDLYHWSYRLSSKVNSPSVFRYLPHDNQKLLEFTSSVKLNDKSFDKSHSLKIYSTESLTDSYEFRLFINSQKSALKISFGQREIRGLSHYNLETIQGGYRGIYAGELWTDFKREPESQSTLSLNTYYSCDVGLSGGGDLKIFVPLFIDKEMGMNTDVQMFKSWENPLSVKLDLNIFSTEDQALQINTNLKRTLQDNGSLYSAELQAISNGMDLNYYIRNALFVSPEKWGKYINGYFIDSENVRRPIEIHFELFPGRFSNKINIFDISVINVDSSIDVKEEGLDANSVISYNDHPYNIGMSLTSNPSFQFSLAWNDKSGSPEKLIIDGSVTMDDSAVISATRIKNDGEEITPVGFVKKSLERDNWWNTDNKMDKNQWNSIWQSLKSEFIERFINVHNNLKNILLVAKNQRAVRIREARNAVSQHHTFIEYTSDELNSIFNEIANDTYLKDLPVLITHTIKALLADAIDLLNYIVSQDFFKDISKKIEINLKKIYNYIAEQIKSFKCAMSRGSDKLFSQIDLALIDFFKMLNKLTDQPMNDDASKPRSVKEYVDSIINKAINTIKELKGAVDGLQDITEDLIKNLPIYETFHDQIEKLKAYPYKKKLWKEIHDYLHELEMTAPTKDFASFINAVDKYIDKVIHDIPVDSKDIIVLRNKGIIVAKSIIFDFSYYVDYDKAMTIYNALRKLTNVGKTVLYLVSPNSFQYSNDSQNMWFDVKEYMQLYQKYLSPSSLLSPYIAQGVLINSNNLITYNGQPYSFMPNTGSYLLAKDLTNNKFSVLANYEDNVLKSISMIIDNDQTYMLMAGGKIVYNSQNVDFPLQNDKVQIWKDVYFFGIESSIGVNVKCTLNLDVVEVFVNGYYHGKVFGLLGAMYQEPTLDFTLPNGKLPNDMSSFFSTYCNTKNSKPTAVDSVETDQQPCPGLFSGVSTLKTAFPVVSPNAYRTICNQIVSSARSQEEGLDKSCLVARAYVSMARDNFVSSCSIPDVCISSKLNELALDSKSQIQISEQSNVADVVILFEETLENQKPFSDVLKPFMEKINKMFNDKGMSKVNFIIIGFSVKPTDSDVHIYTTNSDNNYETILSNVPEWSKSQTSTDENNSKITSQLVDSFKKVIGENSKDKAYKITADYPYTANSVKVVLSISQSLYTSKTLDISLYTFDYITSSLVEQGIKFYLIAPISLSDSSNEGVFGTNGGLDIYTMSAPKGKETTNDGLTFEKSLESDLVFKTGGIMFDSQAFVDGTSNQKNIFLMSLCNSIVERAVIDSRVAKSCSSAVYNGVMPFTKCTVVTA